MAGKVLEYGRHAAQVHAAHVGLGQLAGHARIGVERPRTNGRTAAVQIDHRREAEIHTAGTQLAGHHPGMLLGQPHRIFRVAAMDRADPGQRRQPGKAVDETLHRAAFLVDRDQQVLAADLADRLGQRDQLVAAAVVAAEQDHAGHARRAQPRMLVLGHARAGQADHQHGAVPASAAARSASLQRA